MKDIKKLFRRDKWFLVVMIGFAVMIFCYLQSFYHRTINECTDVANLVIDKGIVITESELNDMIWSEVQWFFIAVVQFLFWGMLCLQFVKWQMFEGKRVREFQHTLPIKSCSNITYDYLSGILFMWVPTVLLWLSVNGYNWMGITTVGKFLLAEAFFYTLAILAKKVTKHMGGAFVFWGIVCYMEIIVNVMILEQEPLVNSWYTRENTAAWMIYLCLTITFVFLSYYCDKKRDLAANGMFSFKIVHYITLVMLLVELEVMFYGSYVIEGERLLWYEVLKGMLAVGIVGGVHYLVRPKNV